MARKRDMDEYLEVNLSGPSLEAILRNLLGALGFEHAGPQQLPGQSGFTHTFEAMGSRPGHLLLVSVGGDPTVWPWQRDESGYTRGDPDANAEPLARAERWCKEALLRYYDTERQLKAGGKNADFLLFHNVMHPDPDECWSTHMRAWAEKPRRVDFHFHEARSDAQRRSLPAARLAELAHDVGACHLSLDELLPQEVKPVSGAADNQGLRAAEHLAKRLRLAQYFRPPTDALMMGVLARSGERDTSFIKRVFEMSLELDHPPAANQIVPQADFQDPVATAKELARHDYIEYEATAEIKAGGLRVIETVRKTAQESFWIKLWNALKINITLRPD